MGKVFYFILNKGAKPGDITHAVLQGKIEAYPAGWDAYGSLELAEKTLNSPDIQKQMKELGIEMEIVPLE